MHGDNLSYHSMQGFVHEIIDDFNPFLCNQLLLEMSWWLLSRRIDIDIRSILAFFVKENCHG